MSEEIQQTRVTFNCGGVELAGYLYRPPTLPGSFRAW